LQDTLGAREKAGRSPLRPAFNRSDRVAPAEADA
jgi:hypothetical protein